MRIKIIFEVEAEGTLDFNYQHQIQGLIYGFLARSDPDYAAWLHKDGFIFKDDKRFKLFVYSGISFDKPVKINSTKGFEIRTAKKPFTFSFQIASPVTSFVQHLVQGIFNENNQIRLGQLNAAVSRVETLPDLSDLSGYVSMDLSPLESPICIKKPMPRGERDVFLFPEDPGFVELLNSNLISKYETLYGKSYMGEPLRFLFHAVDGKSEKQFFIFKKRLDGNGYTKIPVRGTLRPFKVEGPFELVRVGLECGFGQGNSMGCGYTVFSKAGSKSG